MVRSPTSTTSSTKSLIDIVAIVGTSHKPISGPF